MRLFLTTCYEIGTLDAVLKECGLQAEHDTGIRSLHTTTNDHDFIDVPINFDVKGSCNHRCHV